MAELKKIVRFLDKTLRNSKIKDHAINGLQVKGKNEIMKVAVAVDACMEVFEKAKKQGCGLIIVHHGLLWDFIRKKRVLDKNRVDFLKKNRISLYAAHLPLDLNDEYGNNILICRKLNLIRIKKFGTYSRIKIGYKGELKREKSLKEFAQLIKRNVGKNIVVLGFGKNSIKKIAVVSGRAPELIPEASEEKIDAYITGEPKHEVFHVAKELRMNVIFAGHYNTEVFGVNAIGEAVKEKFGIKSVFIDVPTGL